MPLRGNLAKKSATSTTLRSGKPTTATGSPQIFCRAHPQRIKFLARGSKNKAISQAKIKVNREYISVVFSKKVRVITIKKSRLVEMLRRRTSSTVESPIPGYWLLYTSEAADE